MKKYTCILFYSLEGTSTHHAFQSSQLKEFTWPDDS